ncbi:MAG: ATP-grasp domain-containing protein [Planctomycetes bacterium]|nr:ATP-grasp domain-containing protein [Planctomycetota bacterium]
MHVVFVEPAFPLYQRQFVRGLHEAGARVTGIGERPIEALDSELKHWLYRYEQVSSVCNEPEMTKLVKRIQSNEKVDRIEATIEAHIMGVARVREACGIPGTTVKTAYLCRDKPSMKEALRQAGIPCAQSAGIASAKEAYEFARSVGYPVILKPRDGAGASGATRVTNDAEMAAAVKEIYLDRGRSVAIEEFIEGHEGFFDTLTIGGEVVHEFVTHYFPNVLEAMRTRWISPQFIASNRLMQPSYDELRELGRRVIKALDIETSATHMEWFFGPKGLKFSEIGCRPPGVGAWDLYCAANDFDLYREWAFAIVHGRPDQRPSRQYSAGIIALRPSQDGHVREYRGLEEIDRRFGAWKIDQHLPPVGSRTAPVEGGYMANAWMRFKHPDFDELRRMLDTVGQTVKVIAE